MERSTTPRTRSPLRRPTWSIGGAVALLVHLAACGGGTTGPAADPDALTESVVRADYVFRFSPGDDIDVAWQEEYHVWLHEALDLPPTPRVEYRKYRDLDHLRRVTGMDANAWADPNGLVLHTVWGRDNHEIVHVVVGHHLGSPPGLFGEGIAVAHQSNPRLDPRPVWGMRPLHAAAREVDAAGRLPSLSVLIESAPFNALDPEVRYPVSGSFVRYLLDEEGIAPFKDLARAVGAHDAQATVRGEFERIYGVSLDEAWDAWLAFLRS